MTTPKVEEVPRDEPVQASHLPLYTTSSREAQRPSTEVAGAAHRVSSRDHDGVHRTPSHERDAGVPGQRTPSRDASDMTGDNKVHVHDPEKGGAAGHGLPELGAGATVVKPEKTKRQKVVGHLVRIGMIVLILAWWISGLVLKDTRTTKRIIVSTLFGWFFIILLISHYVPVSPLGRPIGAVWKAGLSKPFFALPFFVRLGLGAAALITLILAPAFGFKLGPDTSLSQRGRAIFGLIVFQLGLAASSRNIKKVQWDTVIIGLCFQQILALFVFKTKAGLDLFTWIATLAQDFLNQAQAGVSFFVGQDIADSHFFFFSTLGAIIFFISFIFLLYHWGVMQWIIKRFAWFFFRTMRVSGAEAVVAAASPFVGQGESACLVKPYVAHMTPSELHLTMTSGFSTISGSVFAAYVSFGMPPAYLITSSVMSIPASISISKLRYPEEGEPLTKGRVVVARDKDDATSALHAFSNGAWFGLRVAGLILCNVFTILALLSAVNGLLTYLGKNFGIHHLTLTLIMGYVFYPVAWLMGVENGDILTVARYMGERLITNEFVAFQDLSANQFHGGGGHIISQHSFLISVFSLCGFANLASLGIQIGVLGGLAGNQKAVLAKIGPSALICGYLSTIQTAAIVGLLG